MMKEKFNFKKKRHCKPSLTTATAPPTSSCLPQVHQTSSEWTSVDKNIFDRKWQNSGKKRFFFKTPN